MTHVPIARRSPNCQVASRSTGTRCKLKDVKACKCYCENRLLQWVQMKDLFLPISLMCSSRLVGCLSQRQMVIGRGLGFKNHAYKLVVSWLGGPNNNGVLSDSCAEFRKNMVVVNVIGDHYSPRSKRFPESRVCPPPAIWRLIAIVMN